MAVLEMKVYKNEEEQRLAEEEKRAEGKKDSLRGLQKKERPRKKRPTKKRVDKLSTASEL